ncbi:MAG TPA: hypothetical protein VNU71_10785, partial [Burkholderiaceae bacterium]|nr:hypothetical protein [Burkholderiaceae bacterium]
GACVAAPGATRAQAAALEHLGGYHVDALTPASTTPCDFLLQVQTRSASVDPGPTWRLLARERRNTSDEEIAAVYGRRSAAPKR